VLYLALAFAIVLSALAAVLAAAETSVMLLPLGRVHRLVESEQRGATDLERLVGRPHRVRAASGLAAALAYAAAALLGALLGSGLPRAGGPLAAALFCAAATLFAYALTQALPRTLAIANPEQLGLDTAVVARVATDTLYPVARTLGAPWAWAVRLAGSDTLTSPWATGAEFRAAESDDDTEREEAEEALLEAASDFAEKVAREVMVPRTDVSALPDTATAEEAVQLIGDTGFTRLPVYHGTIDDIRGVLYAKDLLVACTTGGGVRTIKTLVRPAYFVPETKPVEELLVEMRTRTHIAIVADEYGGTAGIVTLEDLLEEIVGEISDEYDREEPLITALGERRYRVDARLPVDELNELFGTDIDIDADSVGGLFTEIAGHIPEAGESVDIEGLRLTVDVLEGTRIRQLTAEPAHTDEGDDNA